MRGSDVLSSRSASLGGYYALMGLAGFLGMDKGLLYAKFLTSEALGSYSLSVLVAVYGTCFCNFGLYRGLDCVLPVKYGAGEDAEAERLRNRAAGLILIASLLFLPIASAAFYLASPDQSMVRILGPLSGFMTVSMVLFGLPVVEMRSRKKIRLLASMSLLRSLFPVALAPWVAPRYGAPGILLVEGLTMLLCFGVSAGWGCASFRFEFREFASLKHVFKVGAPLSLRELVGELGFHLDRWCVATLFGLAAFGRYAFAMTLVTAGEVLRNAIWTQVGPRTAFQLGRDKDVRGALKTLHRVSLGILGLMLAGWFPFKVAVGTVVPLYFRDYEGSIPLFQVLYWGVLFQVINQYEWIPMALMRTRGLFFVSLGVTLLTGAMTGVALLAGWSVLAFAWIFVASRALSAVGNLSLALWLASSGAGRDVPIPPPEAVRDPSAG
jgi:O-antigen/teichoic acid export membrane protein